MKKLYAFIRNHYQEIYKGFLFIFALVLLIMIFPQQGKFKYEFTKGRPWMHEDLYAPFDFAIEKTGKELEEERQEVALSIAPYYTVDVSVFENILDHFDKEFSAKWAERYSGDQMDTGYMEKNRSIALQILDDIYGRGVLEPTPEGRPLPEKIILIRQNVADEIDSDSVLTIHRANEYIAETLGRYEDIDRDLLSNILFDFLDYNVFYDEGKTQEELQNALNEMSFSRGMVLTGEKVVSRGEVVDPETYQKLVSLKKSYEKRLGAAGTYYSILAGQILLVGIAIGVLVLFLIYFRRDIFRDNKKIILILMVMILLVFMVSLMIRYNAGYLYLVPVCIVPIIIRTFFDTRIALYVHLITVIIIGFLVPNSFEFVFLQMITGIIAIMTVVNLQRRSQFFLTSAWIFITYSVLYSGLILLQEGSWKGINPVYFAFFAGSAGLTLFSYPFIWVFEKLFGFITDVTLIELSNTNNILLRELSLKAPGTFQHSLQVANLAEEAVYEVGGNAMLVRTGALYHDIGKMDMPVYFVENQTTGVNPHDELTYEESARIIIDHVIKGIEKAKKYKLPEQIIDFIRTHHGTRKVGYFYIMQKKETPEDQVDEKDFTYHGPIPFSKETAILMMADSVEAASRSLKSYDEDKISKLVDGIIDQQLETGQFANSDITLREITRIKKILKNKLMTIYHIRVEYPI
ncbi:MAG: HDIG domain-containing protein [Bacteroidales bacterium]